MENIQPNVREMEETTGEDSNENDVQVPYTAFFRPANDPLKPTIWPPSKYKNCTRLMELRFDHRHDKVSDSMTVDGWEDSKYDPNRWSQIKKIYARIIERVGEIGEDINNKNEWVRAAKWLDANEKKNLTMNKYILFLREKYCKKRK